jgi:glycerol-3-phosphate acyltransferase PlsY
VSAGSILAALVVPLLAVLWSYPWSLVLAAVLIALLVLYKHRDNLHRLRQGSEAKFF